MDKTNIRQTLFWLIDLIYQERIELVAHKVALTLFKTVDSEGARIFDQFLEQALKHPAPALLADHQAAKDKVEELLRAETPDAALTFLRNWNPTGPVN